MGLIKTYCPEIINPLDLAFPFFLEKIFKKRKATIIATPYKSGRIEYRYDNEEWLVIEPLNGGELSYELNSPVEITCYGLRYHINFAIENAIYPGKGRRNFTTGNIGYECKYYSKSSSILVYGPILSFRFTDYKKLNNDCVGYDNPDYAPSGFIPEGHETWQVLCYGRNGNLTTEPVWITIYGNGDLIPGAIVLLNDEVLTYNIEAYDEVCYGCEFKVYEDETLIFERAEKQCPEVEQFSCELDFEKQESFSVDLLPGVLLYVAEGVNSIPDLFSALTLISSFINALPLPDLVLDRLNDLLLGNPKECLIVFTFFDGLFPNFIGKVCSDSGCPPPYLSVVCSDECEKCPPDTCAVKCGEHICCYGADGKSVKQIQSSEYCNE